MKFYSDIPNLHIIRQRNRGNGTEPFELCVFGENGELETEDKEVIRQLVNIYRHDEPKAKEPKSETLPIKTMKCKKCSFETTNKGELLQHYKKMHAND